jgi:5-enolpyruvylshikimate-3-phosphate synthase
MEASKHSPEPWSAPQSPRTLNATLSLPGSKSLTNRELILAALADGPSTLTGGLVARDTELMISALEALGAGIERDGDSWAMTPINFAHISDEAVQIDCGLAGTVMRFVPPLVLLGFQPVSFDGDERARLRPMAGVIDALRQ